MSRSPIPAAGVGSLQDHHTSEELPPQAAESTQALLDLTNRGMRALIIDAAKPGGLAGLSPAAVLIWLTTLSRAGQDRDTPQCVAAMPPMNHNFIAHYAARCSCRLMVMIDEDSAHAQRDLRSGAIADQ
jgi:hypothetical protein